MKTMKYYMVLIMVMVMATSNAQSLGSIIGQAKKQHLDCDHVAVKNGYLHDMPCGGFAIAARAGYAHFEYTNEEGNATTGGAEYGADLSYRAIVAKQIALRPTVYGLASSNMTFEGQNVKSFEFGAELPIELFLHHKKVVEGKTIDMPNKFWFAIAPCLAFHNVKSIKELDTEAYLLTIPAQSNVFMLGGSVELNYQLGTAKTVKKVEEAGRLYKVTKHHPIRLTLGGKYMHGTFHKPAEGKLELNKWEVYARLSVQL